MELSFKLEEFEGPLDLLLHLISKHKLNILDIEIFRLVEQYMEYIHGLEQADLQIAGEFLEMAARLVYMKTVMLLPRHEEEKEKLKTELTGQLLEYQACKEVAGYLREQNQMGNVFVRSAQLLEVDKTYALCHNPRELLEAYRLAVGKNQRKLPPPATAFTGIVSHKVVSVSSRIFYLLRRLYRVPTMGYEELFQALDRSEMVATFLAVLELMKAKRITVSENQEYVTLQTKQKG